MTYFIVMIKTLYGAIERFFTDKYSYQASTLAFATLLAVVPLFSVAIFITTHFPIFANSIELIRQYVFAHLIPTSSGVIEQYLDLFSKQALHLPVSGIIFSFLTLIFLLRLVKDVINNIWYFPQYHSRKHVIWHWIIILIVPIGMILSIYISHYLFSSLWTNYAIRAHGFNMILGYLLPILINTFGLSVLYCLLPNQRPSWKSGLLGGLIAASLFELAKYLFIFYVSFVPSYELIYGALSVIPVFLFWLYISWIIVIYGALATHALSE